MFSDDIFIMKMSPKMIRDFKNFGYTIEPSIDDGNFYGIIHRFAVFYDSTTNDITYKTIKKHIFQKKLQDFRILYKKLDNNNQYKNYYVTCDGEPILDDIIIKDSNLIL